jgi:hypothetical protein
VLPPSLQQKGKPDVKASEVAVQEERDRNQGGPETGRFFCRSRETEETVAVSDLWEVRRDHVRSLWH